MDRDVLAALIRIVESKDESTAAHTWRVALYAQALAEAAGLDRPEVDRLLEAAVLHDIGKIDIPHRILAKPGPLTAGEFEIMKTHTVLGHERLQRMGVTDPLPLALVRSHHERLDGSGYPDGLRDDEIPSAARYFAVIDTFDAMTSWRPYRPTRVPDAGRRVIEELEAHAGQWYCRQAVELFTAVQESGELDWIMDHFNDEKSLRGLHSAPDAAMLAAARRIVADAERAAAAGGAGQQPPHESPSPGGDR